MDINRLCKGCFRELHEAGQICPFCGFDEKKYETERNPEVLPINTILRGAFIVGKCLGKGGFGITYICWHINLETVVAIKELYPSGIVYRNIDSSSGYDSASVSLTGSGSKEIYQKSLQSFLKEARILGALKLPGIVDVYDCFEENNTVYLVMDYIQGGDLKAYLMDRGGKISEEETLKLMYPVIKSLHEVHQQNIIHRDISPDNILLNKKGEVILVDFGAARNVTAQAAGEQGKSMTVVLKPGYAPMEQYFVHGNQGPWTDIYALCATMYRMMTGTVLNDPGTRNNTDDDEQILRQNLKNYKVSDHTTDVLIIGLKLRVKDRYQSMQELKNALYSERNKTSVTKNRQLAGSQKRSGYQKKPAVASVPSGKGKNKWIGIISTIALLIIVAIVGILSIRKSNNFIEVRNGSLLNGETSGSFREGTKITVRAEKKEGFDFAGWQVEQGNVAFEDADAEETSFTLGKEDVVISAGFVQKTYVLTVNGGTIQGTDSNTGSFHEGEQITIEPEKREHYVFTGWTVSNETVEFQLDGDNLKITMPAEDITVAAGFEEIKPELFSEEEKNCKVGDIITFGSYEQDNDLSNGKETIEWQVLDKRESNVLVISKYALDVKQYNAEFVDVTWETCDLRGWLNREFYNEAFSIEEQKQIEETVVRADDNEYAGNDTRDKVFLLSRSEAKAFIENNDARFCYPTEYAMAGGAWAWEKTQYCAWWLRSPGHSSGDTAARVNPDGTVSPDGYYVHHDYICVRPALWINLETQMSDEIIIEPIDPVPFQGG